MLRAERLAGKLSQLQQRLQRVIGDMQGTSAGEPGNFLQQRQVGAVLIAIAGLPNAQSVNADSFTCGKPGGSAWRHYAAVVGAVRKQNQVALGGRQLTQFLIPSPMASPM